jgi:hypothetical protein
MLNHQQEKSDPQLNFKEKMASTSIAHRARRLTPVPHAVLMIVIVKRILQWTIDSRSLLVLLNYCRIPIRRWNTLSAAWAETAA